MAPIIDSHCHLDFAEYADDLPDVLGRARGVGIVAMICVGAGGSMTPARNAVTLAAREPDIWATVGIHPHDVAKMVEEDWQELEALAVAPRVVGVGETGLDYHYDHSPRDVQRDAFRRFVAMARRTRRPIVCHIRDAHEDAAQILTEDGAAEVGGVIHCFTGNVADARRYLDLGFHLSFSGILTFRTAGDIRDAAAFAPMDRVLVETDAPYLAPIPYRGKRNEPSYVCKTLELLASLKDTDADGAAEATTANARRLFALT